MAETRDPRMKADVHVDGSSRGNPGPSGIGIVVENGLGSIIKEIQLGVGHRTNNEAEYMGVLWGTLAAHSLGITHVHIFSDSRLVVNQINGVWRCKNSKLRALRDDVTKKLDEWFEGRWKLSYIPRLENEAADHLAKVASAEAKVSIVRGDLLLAIYDGNKEKLLDDVLDGIIREV